MVSPQYTLPKQAVYSFTLERETLEDVKISNQKQREAEEELARKREAYEQEKINKQKIAARKIAPGFLDTDTRILHPKQIYNSGRGAEEDGHEQTTDSEAKDENMEKETRQLMPVRSKSPSQDRVTSSTAFDYLKFEQGLAPPDPWDTPENDMVALRSILGEAKEKTERSPPRKQDSITQMPSPYTPHYSPYIRPSVSSYSKDGYWPFNPQSPNQNYPATSISSGRPAPGPAIPPKFFYDPVKPSQSPRPPPPNIPKAPSEYRSDPGSPNSPPPLPPLPPTTSPLNDLVRELINMGFSRSQAEEALEKNENDLTKATNFLLDQAVG
ncbi:hypothetical protein J3Q64DRAFT_1808580 [Phycomyces blakesleeanus]|uniref:UBA domain-containing protein n=1 Tax=Phycomyces blakesleeanus TaxID=4837 RepID=A0ABR3B4E6_PHYBL